MLKNNVEFCIEEDGQELEKLNIWVQLGFSRTKATNTCLAKCRHLFLKNYLGEGAKEMSGVRSVDSNSAIDSTSQSNVGFQSSKNEQ